MKPFWRAFPPACFRSTPRGALFTPMRAVRRLLRLDEDPAWLPSRPCAISSPKMPSADLEHMLRKADRMGSTTSQMEIATPRVNLNVAVTVASLDPPSQRHRATAASAPDTSWCWKISPTCCARKSRRRGAKSRAASRTRSRIRSLRSRFRPSAFAVTWNAERLPTPLP